jgi:6-phosphogluconolactonase (cycloisomerase 2 family)
MTYKLLVGGYTEGGLRVLKFQPNSQSGGTLELQQTTISAGSSPSWVVQHPKDDSLLFVGNEVEDGRLIGIKLSTGDGDTVKGEIAVNVSSGGSHPAHLKVLNSSVVIGNVGFLQVISRILHSITALTFILPFIYPCITSASACRCRYSSV